MYIHKINHIRFIDFLLKILTTKRNLRIFYSIMTVVQSGLFIKHFIQIMSNKIDYI